MATGGGTTDDRRTCRPVPCLCDDLSFHTGSHRGGSKGGGGARSHAPKYHEEAFQRMLFKEFSKPFWNPFINIYLSKTAIKQSHSSIYVGLLSICQFAARSYYLFQGPCVYNYNFSYLFHLYTHVKHIHKYQDMY